MFTRTVFAMSLAAAVLVTGCAKKEEPKVEPTVEAFVVDLAAEEQAIRTRSAEWMNYVNSRETATIANEVYGPDAVVIYDGVVQRGSAEIQAALEKSRAANPDGVISWTSDQVKVAASGDLAVEVGSLTADPDGEGKKPAQRGAFVTVWSKADGKWRPIADAGTENIKAEASAD